MRQDFTTTRVVVKQQKTLIFGLDLGQAQDFSALAVIERGSSAAAHTAKTIDEVDYLHCIHLQRWKLRTSYPAIVADVVKIINGLGPELTRPKPFLAIDATGCGAPVVDLFKREQINAELRPIQIVGGANVSRDTFGMTRVPKRDLVSVVQVGLQNRQLKIADSLDLAEILSRELQNFQVKITDAANDVYGAWREGTHDDLVLALALAVWQATQPVYRRQKAAETTVGYTL